MSTVPDCMIVCNSSVELVKAMRRVGGAPSRFLNHHIRSGWARRTLKQRPYVLRICNDAQAWSWQDSHLSTNAVAWMKRRYPELPMVTYEEVFGND